MNSTNPRSSRRTRFALWPTSTSLSLVLIACFCGASGSRSLGALLSHDSFAYPLNAALPGQTGGTGFNGAWVAGVNTGVPASRFQMVTPSLTYPGLGSDGVRLRVTTGSAQGARRLLAQPMGGDGTVRYVSLLVRPDATPSPSSYFGLQVLGSAGADLFAGKPGGGATTRYVLENAGGTGQVASTRTVTANAVTLIVLRFQFNAGNDRISLYVNPTVGATEPAVADAVKTDLNLGTAGVLALTGPAAWSADELRVGDSFASVLPPGPDFQLRPIPSGSVAEHTVVTRSIQTVDPLAPQRTLAFELIGETYGAQINPLTGEFSWMPGEQEGGQRRTFTVRATSNANPPASVTVSFFLDATEGNQLPELAPILDQSVTEGAEFTYPLVAVDSDDPRQNIFYSLVVKPDGLTVSPTGVLTWRPTLEQAGRSYPVTIFATDTMAGRAERSFTVTVVPRTGFMARWIGTADGDWNNPANWDIGRVPNDNATEFFDVLWQQHPVTARVTGDITVRSLSLSSGGTLDLQSSAANLTIRGSLNWNNGTLSGQGRMTVQGRATLEGLRTDALTLRDGCSLVLNGTSRLESPLRCDGDVRVVINPSASLGVAAIAGFIRVSGAPELRNEGALRIWGQEEPIPFIFLSNRGRVTTFGSTIDFQTGAGLDLVQEAGGHLSVGAGFGYEATLNGNVLLRAGSTAAGQAYVRQARVEGQIQGRFIFDRLSFGSTATSKFSLIEPRDHLSAIQPIVLDGHLELAALQGTIPGPDDVFGLVSSAGNITGGFVGRPFGQRVPIPGLNETMLLTLSANPHRVELRKFLPAAKSLLGLPLSFRLPEAANEVGGCFVVPHPATLLPEGTLAGSSLTVEITKNYDGAVDRLGFRPNRSFPEADEVVFEGAFGSEQTVRFRGTAFGRVQVTGGLVTCRLEASADSEAAVALLGRLRYENTELTADWFTGPDMFYPQRTIVVTLTDANGANEVSRTVDFPVLWEIRLPESLLLPEKQQKVLHLQGWFSSGQLLPVRKFETAWSESCSDPGVLFKPVSLLGLHTVVGRAGPYCCTVTATNGRLQASVEIYAGTLVQRPLSRLAEIALQYCPRQWASMWDYITPECYTTPARFGSASNAGNDPNSIVVTYALEALMEGSVAGQRWAGLYREHGAEVVRLFLEQPSLFTQAQEVLATFQPGIVALLAGRGETVPIYAPMITQVNEFWNALTEQASPALKTVLEREQVRFDNFRMFQDRSFEDWAGLLGIRVPFEPFLHISLMQREATRFQLGLNDVPGIELSLWRSLDLQTWTQVTDAELERNGSTLIFTDPAPPAGQTFYSVRQ
ncbi:MAG: hypothetical protein JNN07_10375 [Verrucomicrobiales bacterium]|nr:hypothetical protein [Verrucomicrobiales bacterium]